MNSNHEQISEAELRQARLTAFALGELDDREHALVESELAGDESARQYVAEVAALAEQLREAYQGQPAAEPSDELRTRIEAQLGTPEAATDPSTSAESLEAAPRESASVDTRKNILVRPVPRMLRWKIFALPSAKAPSFW